MARLVTNRTAATAITVAAVLLSFFLILWLVRGSQPVTEPDRNTSNITREQYRAAVARWNDLHVTDYEATIQQSNWGKWKIVVHVDDAYGAGFVPEARASYSHRIVHFESLGSETANLDVNLIDFMTIGGLFDRVNDALYCQENSCKSREFFLPSRYVIEFDQTMGYPRFFRSTNEYATVETRIENVNILK